MDISKFQRDNNEQYGIRALYPASKRSIGVQRYSPYTTDSSQYLNSLQNSQDLMKEMYISSNNDRFPKSYSMDIAPELDDRYTRDSRSLYSNSPFLPLRSEEEKYSFPQSITSKSNFQIQPSNYLEMRKENGILDRSFFSAVPTNVNTTQMYNTVPRNIEPSTKKFRANSATSMQTTTRNKFYLESRALVTCRLGDIWTLSSKITGASPLFEIYGSLARVVSQDRPCFKFTILDPFKPNKDQVDIEYWENDLPDALIPNATYRLIGRPKKSRIFQCYWFTKSNNPKELPCIEKLTNYWKQ